MSVVLPDNPNAQSATTVGKDYLLNVNTGTVAVPVWTQIGAQRSADLNRSADSIDVSHKTSGGWSAKKAGLRSWSIDLGGLMLLSDAGIEALEYAFLNGKEVNIQLVYPDGSTQDDRGQWCSWRKNGARQRKLEKAPQRGGAYTPRRERKVSCNA